MIIIISEENDYSTWEVARWLKYFGAKYLRINLSDKLLMSEIDLKENRFVVHIDGVKIDLLQGHTYWYRRGGLSFFKLTGNQGHHLSRFLRDENNALNVYLFSSLRKTKTKSIGSWLDIFHNKLTTLKLAEKCGLFIPTTTITGNRKSLASFLEDNRYSITKSIQGTFYSRTKKSIYLAYTTRVDTKDVRNLCEDFEPSLIQEEIKKKFEIRSFFLNDSFYSMAIFSQQNPKTQIDFRNYDIKTPNRVVPYNLPKNVEAKLRKLYKLLCLTSCSTDLILDMDYKYYFLEINPFGQFGMVSKPCNYYLEKKIALELNSYEKRKKKRTDIQKS